MYTDEGGAASDYEFEYRGTVEFPKADRYAVADILDFISKVVHPCVHHFSWEDVEYPKVYRLIDSHADFGATAHRPTGRLPCNRCTLLRKRLRNELLKRLRKAVVGEIFELWDSRLGTVRALESSESLDWWADMAEIFRSDLVKFCKGERYRAVFSDNESPSCSEGLAPSPVPAGGGDVSLASPTHSSGADTVARCLPIPCIETRAIAITKKSLEAAWEIECETGARATAKEVIALLKIWVTSPSRSDDVLMGVTLNGVLWRTAKQENKEYDRAACSVTLRQWFERRKKAQSDDSTQSSSLV